MTRASAMLNVNMMARTFSITNQAEMTEKVFLKKECESSVSLCKNAQNQI